MAVCGGLLLSAFSPQLTDRQCFFEISSALGGTGLDAGNITPKLSFGGKLLVAFFMFTARPFIQTAIDASHQNIAVTFGRMRQGIACLFTASFDTHALFACRAIRTRDTRHDAAFTNDLYAIAVTRGIKIRLNA
jgi:hypothetical protein